MTPDGARALRCASVTIAIAGCSRSAAMMARTLVGRALGVAPDGWRWREGPHGRPEIASPGDRPALQSVPQRRPRRVRARPRPRPSAWTSKNLDAAAPGSGDRAALLLAGRGRRHRARRATAGATVPDVLDAERGVPQGARPGHLRAARRHLVHARRRRRRPRIGFHDSLAGTDDRWRFHLAAPRAAPPRGRGRSTRADGRHAPSSCSRADAAPHDSGALLATSDIHISHRANRAALETDRAITRTTGSSSPATSARTRDHSSGARRARCRDSRG